METCREGPKIGTKGEFGYQGQVHFADHFYQKMKKIGQAIQKIWQGEETV